MAIFNIGSIVERIKGRVENIPSETGDVGSGNYINWFVEGAINDINGSERIQSAITETNIEPKFQNILINLGCAYTLARMNEIGVNFDFNLEGFNVKKSGKSAYHQDIDFYLEQANSALNNMGKKVNYGKVNG